MILWFEEQHEEDARLDKDKTEHTRYFHAKSNNDTDGLFQLLQKRPDLGIGQPHPRDKYAFVKTFSPHRGAAGLFDVQVEYTTEVEDTSVKNPLGAPAKISKGSVTRRRIRTFDIDDKAVVNTAGEPFTDPPAEVEAADAVWKIKKNLPAKLPEWVDTYENCVNSDPVTIRGRTLQPETLKVMKIECGDVIDDEETGVQYCEADIELQHNADGWKHRIPNFGSYELVPVKVVKQLALGAKTEEEIKKKKLKKFKTFKGVVQRPILINGQKPHEKQFLDADGRWIQNATGDDVLILEFDFCEKKPFNGFIPLK